MIVNARMYSVTAATKAAWREVLTWAVRRAGLSCDWLDHDPPSPMSALWQRDDLGCAMMCGLPFARREPGLLLLAAPVPSPARYGGRPVYFTDVVVRADARFATLAETREGVLGYTTPDSQSGFYALRWQLRQSGLDPARWKGRVGNLLNAQGVLAALRDRRIDAGPLDSYSFDLLRSADPSLHAGVRVVATTPATPIPPLVATAPMADDALARLRAALLAVGAEPSLSQPRQTLLLQGFAPVAAADYAVLRERAALLDREAPWPGASIMPRE